MTTVIKDDIKITRLPNNMNPNKIIENKIQDKYAKCPFCGTNHLSLFYGISFTTIDWYGKYNNEQWWKFWEPNRHWKQYHYTCAKCGAAWESEIFPTDIGEFKK